MILYIGIAVFILLGSITKQSRWIYYSSLVVLFIITAFRDISLGGTDAIIYREFFEKVPKLTMIGGYDSKYSIGYTLLNSVIKQFTGSFYVYQIMYTIITIILLIILLKHLELNYKEKCLFIFSYFCFRFIWNTWVLLRQNMANLFFWLFLIMLYKKRKELVLAGKQIWCKQTYILLLAALIIPILFHTSAWVNIGLVWMFFLLEKLSVKLKVIVISVGSIIIYLFGRFLYPYLYLFVIKFVDSRYSMYESSVHIESNIFETVFKMCFFFVLVWYYEREEYPYKEFVLNAQGIMILLGSMNVGTFDRMLEYYAIGLYMGMTLILNIFKGRSKFLGAVCFGVGMIVILCRFLLMFDAGQFIDYAFEFA